MYYVIVVVKKKRGLERHVSGKISNKASAHVTARCLKERWGPRWADGRSQILSVQIHVVKIVEEDV